MSPWLPVMPLSSTQAWMHDLSPFLLRLWGDFGIRWYGLSYAVGFLIAFLMLRWLSRRGAALIPVHRVGDAIMILVIGAVAGGRLGYILIYEPSLLTLFSSSPPWWGVLMVNHGGMASHGGMVGVLLGCFWLTRGFPAGDGSRIPGPPFLHMMDLTAFLAPAGLFLGRIANFINGELLGKIVAMPGEQAPWWAVKYPQEFPSDHDCSQLMSPAQALERREAIEKIVHDAGYTGDLAEGYRHVVEKIQNGNAELARQLEPWISARHPSQIYQAVAEGLVVGATLWILWRRPRKQGVIASVFLIEYGILRIATELYRLPDAHLHVQRIAGLSRGQWLSVGMVAAGAVLLGLAVRSKSEKVGGWGVGRTVRSA